MCEPSRYPPAIHVSQLATTPELWQWLVWRPAEIADWLEHIWAPGSNFRLTPTFDSVAGLDGRSSRSLTVNWKLRKSWNLANGLVRIMQSTASACEQLCRGLGLAGIGSSKMWDNMWHNMCLLLSASFRSRSLLKANTFVVAWWKWARHSAPQMLKSDKRAAHWSTSKSFVSRPEACQDQSVQLWRSE